MKLNVKTRFNDLLYAYEHNIIRDLFFERKGGFINAIAGKPEILWNMFDDFCKGNNEEDLYEKEDFRIEKAILSEDDFMINILCPYPEEQPLCYNIYLVFNKDFSRQMMFCLESGGKSSLEPTKDVQFLCGWDEKKNHINYGPVDFNQIDVLMKCFTLYKTKYNL